MATVRDLHCLGGWVIAGESCAAAVNAGTKFGWVMFWECCKLLYGKEFLLKLNGIACKSCVITAIL